jgi:FtsH-binding integral membrane protein
MYIQANKEENEIRDAPEDPTIFKYEAEDLRMGFIRKVYLILTAQLTLSAIMIGVSVYNDDYKNFMKANPWLIIVCAVVSIVTLYSLVCYTSVSRKIPLNYILLFLFTVCEAYMTSSITMAAKPEVVLIAAILTATVVVALTVYAFTTKTDFTMLGGLLFVAALLLLAAGILQIFIKNRILETVISCLSCLVFSVYLIYDTQLIVGKHANALSLDDYIQGALQLYIDIIRIFIEILRILSALNSNN